MQPAAHEVLDFWFDAAHEKEWFDASSSFDDDIREKFLPLYESAHKGELNHWAENARSLLALVIVLDQFPRNMFRGLSRQFESDIDALLLSQKAVELGWDKGLTPKERQFLYMPYMHSESLEVQEKGLSLYTALNLPEALDFARRHRDVIARFGRFPHRNVDLFRADTPEESRFLAAGMRF